MALYTGEKLTQTVTALFALNVTIAANIKVLLDCKSMVVIIGYVQHAKTIILEKTFPLEDSHAAPLLLILTIKSIYSNTNLVVEYRHLPKADVEGLAERVGLCRAPALHPSGRPAADQNGNPAVLSTHEAWVLTHPLHHDEQKK